MSGATVFLFALGGSDLHGVRYFLKLHTSLDTYVRDNALVFTVSLSLTLFASLSLCVHTMTSKQIKFAFLKHQPVLTKRYHVL